MNVLRALMLLVAVFFLGCESGSDNDSSALLMLAGASSRPAVKGYYLNVYNRTETTIEQLGRVENGITQNCYWGALAPDSVQQIGQINMVPGSSTVVTLYVTAFGRKGGVSRVDIPVTINVPQSNAAPITVDLALPSDHFTMYFRNGSSGVNWDVVIVNMGTATQVNTTISPVWVPSTTPKFFGWFKKSDIITVHAGTGSNYWEWRPGIEMTYFVSTYGNNSSILYGTGS